MNFKVKRLTDRTAYNYLMTLPPSGEKFNSFLKEYEDEIKNFMINEKFLTYSSPTIVIIIESFEIKIQEKILKNNPSYVLYNFKSFNKRNKIHILEKKILSSIEVQKLITANSSLNLLENIFNNYKNVSVLNTIIKISKNTIIKNKVIDYCLTNHKNVQSVIKSIVNSDTDDIRKAKAKMYMEFK